MRRSMDIPEVSVVLCTHNREALLPRAAESVLGQDHRDLELIIVDDASTDRTEEVVRSFSDDRVVYVRNGENVGAAASRNRGIALARGEFVAFQDDDDVWLPGKLKRQVKTLRDPRISYGACCSSYWKIGPAGKRLVPGKRVSNQGEDLFRYLLRWNLVSIPTLLARKECLMRVGALDERLDRLIDWDLALRLAREYPMFFCTEPLLVSYHTESSITEDVDAYIDAVDLILSKYAEDYERRWWLVANHYLFNAKYLAKNRRYLQALEHLTRSCRIPFERFLRGGYRIA